MESKIKSFCLPALAFGLAATTAMPVGVFAEEMKISVGSMMAGENLYISEGTKTSADGTATYDATTGTLTLNGFNSAHASGKGVFSNVRNLNIALSGENYVENIAAEMSSLKFSGTGKLTCVDPNEVGAQFNSRIYASSVEVNSGTFDFDTQAYGILAADILVNGGTLTIDSKANGLQGSFIHIAGGNLSVNSEIEAIRVDNGVNFEEVMPGMGAAIGIYVEDSIKAQESGLSIKTATRVEADVYAQWSSTIGYAGLDWSCGSWYDDKFCAIEFNDKAAKTIHLGTQYANAIGEEEDITHDTPEVPENQQQILSGDASIIFDYEPEDALSFTVSKIENKETIAKVAKVLDSDDNFAVFDFSVLDGDEAVTQAEGGFKLTMPIPENLKQYKKITFKYTTFGDDKAIFHEEAEATISGDKMTVVLPHLSVYTAIGSNAKVDAPKTGLKTENDRSTTAALKTLILPAVSILPLSLITLWAINRRKNRIKFSSK